MSRGGDPGRTSQDGACIIGPNRCYTTSVTTPRRPAPIECSPPPADEQTRPFAVPFELLEECHRADDQAPPLSPFELVATTAPHGLPTPSRSFGVESTGEFRLDDFLGSTGDVLLLGDPLDVASTTIIRATLSSDEGDEQVVTTSICIGRDIERMLGPQTVLGVNPLRPTVELSGFEQFVVGRLDGSTPIEGLARETGLSMGDLRIALALLADKDQLVVVTTAPSPPSSSSSSPWDVPSVSSVAPAPAVSRVFGPASVLRRVDGVDASGLSALEQFVLGKVDGERTVQQLRDETRLSDADISLALELLQRRGLVERATPLSRGRAVSSSGDAPPPVIVSSSSPPPPVIVATSPVSTPKRSAAPPVPRRPSPVDALLQEAERKEGLGDLQGAASALEQATGLEPKNSALFNRLGTVRVRQHDLVGALAALNTALALSPDDPTIVSNQRRVASLAAQVARARR